MKQSVVALEEDSKLYITIPIEGNNVNMLRKREGCTTLRIGDDTFAEVLCVIFEHYTPKYQPLLHRLHPLFERLIFQERDSIEGKGYDIAIAHFFKDHHGSYMLVHVAVQELVTYLIMHFYDVPNPIICIPPFDHKFHERIYKAYHTIIPLPLRQ